MTDSPLRIRLLGAFAVEGYDEQELGSRKGRLLLKRLAVESVPVSAEVLAEALWGDDQPSRPADQVAVLVSRLRSVLGSERIVRGDGGYRLVADWRDLDELAERTTEAARRLETGSHASARAAAQAALALRRGPLLADEPDAEWAEPARVTAQRMTQRAREVAATAALAVGATADAISLTSEALVEDPYDEAALRRHMVALAVAGRPATALAAYERMRETLAEELGVDPAPETEAVWLDLLAGHVPEGLAQPVRQETPADDELLPGRAGELSALTEMLSQVTASAGPRLLALVGEAGMGKTRLLDHWLARSSAAVVLRGRGDDHGADLPLQPVLDAVFSEVRERGELPELADDLALLATLTPTGAAEKSAVEAMVARPMTQTLLFAALVRVVAQLAGPGPAVLVIDDAHLADRATLDWLRFLRRSTVPVLAVAAFRPGEGIDLEADRHLTLEPLDEQAVCDIVGAERASELLLRSGGNPLFLVELARAVDAEIPTTLKQAIVARAARSGEARATLTCAAVLDNAIDLDLLARLLGTPTPDLLDHLEEGVARGLLVERAEGFAFRHALVREALAEEVGSTRSAWLHREAARLLPLDDPLAVARHARLGGDVTREVEALAAAAALATARYDHAEAERLLTEALALQADPGLLVLRARSRSARGDHEAAMADAQEAASAGAGAPALEVAALAAYFRRDFEQAGRLADDAAAVSEDPSLRANCVALAGRCRQAVGDMVLAEACFREALVDARGPVRDLVSAWLTMLTAHRGRAAEGLRMLPSVLLSPPATDPYVAVHTRFAKVYALGALGRVAELLPALDDLDAEIARQGNPRYAGRTDNFRGWALRSLGLTEAADDRNTAAREAAASIGYTEAHAYALLDLAEGRYLAGDLAGLADLLAQAEELQKVEHVFRWRHQLRASLLAGRLALSAGDADLAAERAQALSVEAESRGAPRYAVLARLLGAQAAGVSGSTLDKDQVAADLALLPEVAGLEAWWVTAEVAASTAVDAWETLAAQRVSELAARSADQADRFARYAATWLEMKSTAGRSG